MPEAGTQVRGSGSDPGKDKNGLVCEPRPPRQRRTLAADLPAPTAASTVTAASNVEWTTMSGRRIPVVATSVLAALVLVAGTVAAQTQRFSDVPPDHPDVAAIAWAADVGLTVGYDDGTFRPDEPLPRWAALVFMDRFYDKVLQANTADNFTRSDMMALLHTIATNVATTTPTTSHSRDANHPNLRIAVDAVLAEHPQMAGLVSELRYRESTPADRPCGRVLWFIRDNCLYTEEGADWWTIYNSDWDNDAAPHWFVFHIGMVLYSEVQTLVFAMQDEGISDTYAPVLSEFTQAMATDCSQVGPYACQPGSNFASYAYAGDAFAASVLAPGHGLSETTTSSALVTWLISVVSEAPCADAALQEVDGRVSFRCTQRRN